MDCLKTSEDWDAVRQRPIPKPRKSLANRVHPSSTISIPPSRAETIPEETSSYVGSSSIYHGATESERLESSSPEARITTIDSEATRFVSSSINYYSPPPSFVDTFNNPVYAASTALFHPTPSSPPPPPPLPPRPLPCKESTLSRSRPVSPSTATQITATNSELESSLPCESDIDTEIWEHTFAHTPSHNWDPPLPSAPQLSSTSSADEHRASSPPPPVPSRRGAAPPLPGGTRSPAHGEKICFCGWVQLFPHSPPKKEERGRRCWAEIRDGLLSFKEDEESTQLLPCSPSHTALREFDYVGRNDEREGEIMMHMERQAKGKERVLKTIRFAPEDAVAAWLLLLAKSLCPNDSMQSSLEIVDVAGRLWVKQGVGGAWTQGWAYTRQCFLVVWLSEGSPNVEVDMRKVVSVTMSQKIERDGLDWLEGTERGPLVIVQSGASLLYLQANHGDHLTEQWQRHLNTKCKTRLGCPLEENRLTNEYVPVLVSECLDWISLHGMEQPGIYRRNGSVAEVRRLFKAFIEDPHTVSLNAFGDEAMYAVAGVLRQFFRQLESPLVPLRLQADLFRIAGFADESLKLDAYHHLLQSLQQPPHQPYYCTLRKLLGHLQQIAFHSDKNLATVENLCCVFGPTIFTVDNMHSAYPNASAEIYSMSQKQSQVMRDLLLNYNHIFDVSLEELEAEEQLAHLRNISKAMTKPKAQGFLVPVHLHERGNQCFNVQAGQTASEVLLERMEKMVCPPNSTTEPSSASTFPDFSELTDRYALFELIHGGSLERRIGPSETLTSIVLDRWLRWGLNHDADSAFLLMKKDTQHFDPNLVHPFAEGVKLAEPASRSYKGVQLRVNATKLTIISKKCYKKYQKACADPKTSKKVELLDRLREAAEKPELEWNLDQLLWFYGHDRERKPPYPHCLTFFPVHAAAVTNHNGASVETQSNDRSNRGDSAERKKSTTNHSNLTGYCLAFKDGGQRDKWLNTMMVLQQEYLSIPLLQL